MSAHVWINTGIVNRGSALRAQDKYCIFRCAGCGQELWHYYDLTLSPMQAAEIEHVPERCEPGTVQLVTHRQAALYWSEMAIELSRSDE